MLLCRLPQKMPFLRSSCGMTLHSEVAIKAHHLFSTEVDRGFGVLGNGKPVVLVKQAEFDLGVGCGWSDSGVGWEWFMDGFTWCDSPFLSPFHVTEFRTKTQVENVSSILRRYPAALIAGAPFPDYLYACGTDHGAGHPDPFGAMTGVLLMVVQGEDAHWHTFHAKAAKYIREKHLGWQGWIFQNLIYIYIYVCVYIYTPQKSNTDTKNCNV